VTELDWTLKDFQRHVPRILQERDELRAQLAEFRRWLEGLGLQVVIDRFDAALAAEPSGPPESMRWEDSESSHYNERFAVEVVVAWVNANGGEARFNPPTAAGIDGITPAHQGRIAVRDGGPSAGGWVYAKPGDTVQMTDEWFNVQVSAEQGFTCRVFRVVSEPSGSPATDDEIEQRFQAARHEAHERYSYDDDEPSGPEPTTSDEPTEHQLEHESFGTWPCAWGGSTECPIVAELTRRDAVTCEHGKTRRHEVECHCGGVFHLGLCPGPAASGTPAVER